MADSNKNGCAVDTFMQGISELTKVRDTFAGVSNDKNFILKGVTYFQYGKKKSRFNSKHTVVNLDCPNGGQSTIALESLWAFLDELYQNGIARDSYIGLVGNCKANEVAQNLECNLNWIEIATKSQNSAHGQIWRQIFNKTGLRIVLSSRDMIFRGYIEACAGDITPDYVMDYPNIVPVTYAGTKYWVVS